MAGTSKNLLRSSIRRLLMIPMVGLSLLLAGVCVWTSVNDLGELRSIENAERLDVGTNKFVTGLFEVLMERLATNNGLQAEGPASAEILAEITTRRTKVRENFEPGLLVIEAMEFPGKDELLAELKRTLAVADAARREADQALRLPRDQRNEALRTGYVPTITTSVNAALKVWFGALHSAAGNDATLSRLAVLKELGWRLRDVAGGERSHISAAMAASAPIAPEKLLALTSIQDRVSLLMNMVDNLTADPATPKMLTEAVARAKAGYAEFRAIADQARQASETGAPYAFTSPEWVATTTPQLGTMLNIMYTAGQAGELYTAGARQEAFKNLLGSIALLAVALTLSGAGLTVLIRRVTRPLEALTTSVGRLAAGDIQVEVPAFAHRDEIGRMAEAVQVFKDAAQQNRRLEQEAAAAEDAQAAQRDRQSAIDNSKAEDLKVFVHHVEAGFDALSSGDLTTRMKEVVAPEFERIRTKFNASIASLENTIGAVVSAVGTMRVGLDEITVAAGDLSQRTEQQAASLEETVAALADVTRGVDGTASEALKAQNAASITLKNAEKGGVVVAEAVEAMSQIEQSSEKIGKIIVVIDEIAFQTNLLALNAGVEAARAGEAGRGFAVVAQEVRGLAQRSAEAAKEIKGLIATSSAQVGHGVGLVTASGRSLEEIVAQVATMSEVVTGIARSASKQSLSLKDVSVAADKMDQVTKQNAAMVEQTTAAAQGLLSETNDLAALIQRFRTSHVDVRSSPAAVPAKRSKAPAHRPIVQMRAAGAGGAAPRTAPASDEWAEF